MLALLLALAAHAAPVGHYHPDDVAAASSQFANAQRVAGTTFERRAERASALAAAIRHYEEALDLLGNDAPADQRARHGALEQQYNREYAVLADFANAQVDAFSKAFSEAMERAIAGRELQECRAEAASSGPRMTPRFGGGPAERETCVGEPMSAELAKTMDTDPVLATALDAVLTARWPSLSTDARAQAPIGPTDAEAVLLVRPWFDKAAPEALAAIERADEDARLEFEAAIESGATKAELEAMVDDADAVTATTSRRRAEAVASLKAATESVAAKLAKKGSPVLAWCPQPSILGGCTLPPADDATATAVFEHPKVRRAADKADSYRP